MNQIVRILNIWEYLGKFEEPSRLHREWFVNIQNSIARFDIKWIINRECSKHRNRPSSIEINEYFSSIYYYTIPIFIVRRMGRKFEIFLVHRRGVPSQMIREHSNSLQARLLD